MSSSSSIDKQPGKLDKYKYVIQHNVAMVAIIRTSFLTFDIYSRQQKNTHIRTHAAMN